MPIPLLAVKALFRKKEQAALSGQPLAPKFYPTTFYVLNADRIPKAYAAGRTYLLLAPFVTVSLAVPSQSMGFKRQRKWRKTLGSYVNSSPFT
ncbi:hypothetical protein CEB3_c22660 [Peptococcaceae bacterium CEB3]|nr:hypothetical protein CEB3_c22660 [Peptococcaceae bacterium CEB3]